MSNEFRSSFSRRNFMRGLGVASVAAASWPSFAAVKGASSPLQSRGLIDADPAALDVSMSDSLIFISMNENPLGPAPSALDAIQKTVGMGNRYHGDIIQETVSTAIDLHGMRRGYVGLFPGTTGPLNLAIASNIGPDRPLIHAELGYEQGPSVADAMGAPKIAVKLTPTHAHDVRAMVAASPKAGAYYIVNPNNPTGTLTPKEDIVWLLKNKPAGSVVIVDEAYHEFCEAESCVDLVAADQDIIVTRTFSKLYGMAGLRAGLCFARPEYFQKFRQLSHFAPSLASVSITSAAGANAAMKDKDIVPLRRKINADNREQTIAFLTKRGYRVLPGSQTNFFMVDTHRPGSQFQSLMLDENVVIGRTWDSMPTYVRVTVGTRDEMQRFETAFVKCMDKPVTADGAALHHPALLPCELNRGEIRWA